MDCHDGPGRAPGEWYLHLFAPEQPDFNWANPEVRAEFEDILRFWFDRGADGIRIDSAALLTKDPGLPEFGPGDPSLYSDRDDVHDIYRAWRAVADDYSGRVLIGEIWLADAAHGSRVPLPWAGQEPPFGFSPPGATRPPWLPQPKEWRELTVQTQTGEAGSMLELYRRALRIRRAEPALGAGAAMTWLPAPDGVLAFDRGGVACVANLSPTPVELPPHTAILLASAPLPGILLPPDTAAWLRIPPQP